MASVRTQSLNLFGLKGLCTAMVFQGNLPGCQDGSREAVACAMTKTYLSSNTAPAPTFITRTPGLRVSLVNCDLLELSAMGGKVDGYSGSWRYQGPLVWRCRNDANGAMVKCAFMH